MNMLKIKWNKRWRKPKWKSRMVG